MFGTLKRILLVRTAYWISRIRLRGILRSLNEDSLVIDCGANVGDISALFLETGASVIAFEPDPVAHAILVDRFKGHPRFILYDKAVSDHEGSAPIYFHRDRRGAGAREFTTSSSLVAEKRNVDTGYSMEVGLVDLSAFVASLGRRVDVLKLDVEGAEIAILRKMLAEATYERIGLMLVETHEKKIVGHAREVESLRREISEKGIRNIHLNWI
jgi:FkbM family methyltransferase